MAASEASREAAWLEKLNRDLDDTVSIPPTLYSDNRSAVDLIHDPKYHARAKHIDIRYHHLRDCVARRIMLLEYISTEEQDADILTKALSKCKFEFHRDKIGW